MQQSVRAQQQIGSVASIQIVPQSSMNGTGGALLGAVLGGVVGNQFGGGSGRALATGVGVIGGAVAGNQIAMQNQQGNQIYRVLDQAR